MGGEILASDFQLTLGGSSAIFACGVAKLGHRVTLISKVGADDFGEFCLAALRKAGVSTRHIARAEHLKTGVTIALSTRNDRALITYPGTIAALSSEDFGIVSLKGHHHLHMSSYFLQTRLRPSFPQIFRTAKELGLSTSFDPNTDPAHVWSDSIREVFAYTDLLFLNESEALQLTHRQTAKGALKALSKNVPCVIVKRGPKGALAAKDGESISVLGFKVKPADTTGAGDSFAAGFVSSYLQGRPLAECLGTGNACGALSTQQAGGIAGQPTFQELKRFLATHRLAVRLSEPGARLNADDPR
jgi:sugar/nucleoside kinase (ribokinase family)